MRQHWTLYGLLPSAFPADWNYFFCFNSFCLVSSYLFFYFFSSFFSCLHAQDKLTTAAIKPGAMITRSRVSLSLFLSFYSPRLPFAATTSLLQLRRTCCVTCIGPIIIELCFALAPSGFPLARRIGHPYQQRTPPKRKKPRTSFTRLQVIFD